MPRSAIAISSFECYPRESLGGPFDGEVKGCVICRLQIILMPCQDLANLRSSLQLCDAHAVVWVKTLANSILSYESVVTNLFNPNVSDHLWKWGKPRHRLYPYICRMIWPRTTTRITMNLTQAFAWGHIWAYQEIQGEAPHWRDRWHILDLWRGPQSTRWWSLLRFKTEGRWDPALVRFREFVRGKGFQSWENTGEREWWWQGREGGMNYNTL